MSNPWFRLYAEFAHDPKVQMLSEAMQRRYVMFMCLRCSNALVTLHETEIAFYLRITDAELAETKALFVSKGFVDFEWVLLNWEKRQFASDTSNARVAKHRALQKEKQTPDSNGDVTLPKRNDNALDTDTEQKVVPIGTVARTSLPTCPTQSVIDLFHEVLPELPQVRLLSDTRKKALSAFWKFVLTSKRSDGTARANNTESAMVWIRGYFDRTRNNDFLMGRGQRSGAHENWTCDIDFLLSEKGRKQVIEKTKDAA